MHSTLSNVLPKSLSGHNSSLMHVSKHPPNTACCCSVPEWPWQGSPRESCPAAQRHRYSGSPSHHSGTAESCRISCASASVPAPLQPAPLSPLKLSHRSDRCHQSCSKRWASACNMPGEHTTCILLCHVTSDKTFMTPSAPRP